MPSIFLSHTSFDKPFVEKLATDLKRIGVNVWFDKWQIRVGESITWKIEEGIRENEFLGIIFSPEALNSEWVKTELSSGWVKQIQNKRIVVLPILYRDCQIPLFIADRKYADFRKNYQSGFKELAGVLGVKEIETLSIDNWRRFTRSPTSSWQQFRVLEFERLVTTLVDRAREYNWSSWVGGTANPFSITLHSFISRVHNASVTLKLNGRSFAYMASYKYEANPNRLRSQDFDVYVGNTINECEEFVWRRMEDFRRLHGDPTQKSYHSVSRFLKSNEILQFSKKIASQMSWYKGNNLPIQS
ncbi:MAG: toll/interleukin-1 receptor domain-containing protein [Candidatus Manganitrophus sp.]|nr:toll/interleukin-1 receptor domain-containing protein [Candidatus Manganitrophus sp.]MDC4224713.1 toll/interleukin-1 receptor domain-containing protein [Candidatus Manganitrophus sp.]WDT70308.1 MAG: toll/interleukin-1 receptor domain-containing protein [Candidatus Manganitrophus sp.]